LPKVACVQAHRWRYAQPKRTDLGNLSGAIYLWDIDASLGACGDWITPAEPQGVLGRPSGLSRALESGAAMAGEILRSWIDRNPIQKQAIQQMLF
jgi:predicted NAD/FAD-dependent oxidoreductase